MYACDLFFDVIGSFPDELLMRMRICTFDVFERSKICFQKMKCTAKRNTLLLEIVAFLM